MKPFPFAIWPNTLQKSNSPQEITGDIFDSDSDANVDRKSTRLNSSHSQQSRMPSSA